MEVQASPKLTSLQLELLKIYSFKPSEEELQQIKEMLAMFFAHRFTEHIAKANSEDLKSETISLQPPSQGVEKPHFLSDVIGSMAGPKGDELAEIVSREFQQIEGKW
ncbi:MAG: hypothetical protein KA138_13590 [Saprospiraceae bacterium]|nr:hypothetical protein [Saprospiraceae bacterium]